MFEVQAETLSSVDRALSPEWVRRSIRVEGAKLVIPAKSNFPHQKIKAVFKI
jgi:hypothetical protein